MSDNWDNCPTLLIATTAILMALMTVPALGQETKAKPKSAPKIDAIQDAMQEFVDNGTVAGAVTLVGHQGKVVHLGAVGHADIEAARPMKPSTMFAIASMTKPITATAIMILQDEGKLSVDDEVQKYLPEYAELQLKDGGAIERPITIRDCLTHTSGVHGSQIVNASLQEVAQEIAGRGLAFQPGDKWQYSPGLTVAGRIIEVVSGQSYEAFLATRIFDPVGMNYTTFFPDAQERKRMATIYQPSETPGELNPTKNHIVDPATVETGNPSGGLISIARDMFRFYQMVLNGGKFRKQRIVSQAAVDQMTSPQTGDLKTGFTPGNAWGLGWCVVRKPQGVTSMLSSGTFGHGGAFGTQGWVDPETETIYVLMIQRAKLGNGDASPIRKAFQQAAVDALR